MIRKNDVVRLLALAAAADQRTVGEEDVALWLGVATTAGWTAAAARRAVVEHYSAGADRPRITPAAITDRIRTIRRLAAASFELPRIPDHIADADYPAWLRTQIRAHCDARLGGWAETGTPPDAALPAAQGAPAIAGAPAAVRAQLGRDMARFGRMPT